MLKTPEETQRRAAHADRPFVHHLLLVVLAAAGVLAAWQLSSVLMLAFGTALLALLLRGLARVVSRWNWRPACFCCNASRCSFRRASSVARSAHFRREIGT